MGILRRCGFGHRPGATRLAHSRGSAPGRRCSPNHPAGHERYRACPYLREALVEMPPTSFWAMRYLEYSG
jgi:hypothetical protein